MVAAGTSGLGISQPTVAIWFGFRLFELTLFCLLVLSWCQNTCLCRTWLSWSAPLWTRRVGMQLPSRWMYSSGESCWWSCWLLQRWIWWADNFQKDSCFQDFPWRSDKNRLGMKGFLTNFLIWANFEILFFSGLWTCDRNQTHIPLDNLCESYLCSDRSDLSFCECGKERWKCPNEPNCLDNEQVCNGYGGFGGCADKADEDPELCDQWECPGHLWPCANNKQCIPKTSICDGGLLDDCADGSDEASCETCMDGMWKCKTQPKCIRSSSRCNGLTLTLLGNCLDKSDEEMCEEWTCDDGLWQCRSGLCIIKEFVCDSIVHCPDGDDETMNCTSWTCSPGNWQCHDGICIAPSKMCDGVDDCVDHSDEWNCANRECSSESWKCHSGNQCVLQRKLCDTNVDCYDASDEMCEHKQPHPIVILGNNTISWSQAICNRMSNLQFNSQQNM